MSLFLLIMPIIHREVTKNGSDAAPLLQRFADRLRLKQS